MLRLPQVTAAIINGVWSGYPLCCVRHYCRLVRAGVDPAAHDAAERGVDLTDEWVAEGGDSGPQYVRCPACRRRGVSVTLRCQRAGRIVTAE